MSIAILLQQILIIFLEIGTGAAVTKLGIMDDRNSKFLSNLVMSVTLPCTLLASASIDGGREAVAGMLKGYVALEIFYILTIGKDEAERDENLAKYSQWVATLTK